MGAEGQPRRPNILIVCADGLRHDDLCALGNGEVMTPNLDKLVGDGTVFTHAHIMGSMSGAVCIPSRAMLMTGRDLFDLDGGIGRPLPESHTTMPEHLRGLGYTTFHSGFWHQGPEAFARSWDDAASIFGMKQGWYEECDGHWHLPVHDFDPAGVYGQETGTFVDAPVAPFEPPFTKVREDCRHSTEIITDGGVEFLKSYDGDAPFFLHVAHIAVHDPLQSSPRYRDLYDGASLALPPNFMAEHPFDNGELRIRDELLEPWPRTPEMIRERTADYYAILTQMDAQIGRLLDALRTRPDAENTLVVFTADHGIAHGRHGLLGKQNMYDHSMRVPLVVAGPGITSGARTDALCYLLDLFPTLCELIDAPTPEAVTGRSLTPALRDSSAEVRDAVRFAYRDVQRGITRDGWKLIGYTVDGVQTVQLFHLRNDPWEVDNLEADPRHRERRDAMLAEVQAWWRAGSAKLTCL